MLHEVRKRRPSPKCRVDSNRPLRHAYGVAERDLKSPPTPAEYARRERLADGVEGARERLQITQEELAEQSGLGIKTIQRVEWKQVKPRATTFSGLDKGCRWVPGSARLLYQEGRTPIALDEIAESAAATGRPAGLIDDWTDEEIERIRSATRQQIADEAASIAKFAGEDAHFRYLHDVALIKLAAVGAGQAQGSAAL